MKSTRRLFLKTSVPGAIAAGFPSIVPSSVFGATAPSNRINIGAIGVGRISRAHDMPGVLQYTGVAGRDNRIAAVCDLSAERVELGKQFVDDAYTKKLGTPYKGTKGYSDFRELLAHKEIDAVLISTPDHQHARLAVAAVAAGKDVYLQKPASLTIREGRMMADRVNATDRILQVGSQQRSWKQFARAVELVRNGRIGTVQRVEIGLPGDPSGGNPQPMPVPAGFNYDAWLGSTPEVPYTVDRVMPLEGFDRPGWLRMEQFGAGMITGWGAHHVDTAHWGMDTELTGPVEIWGQAQFPSEGLWNVHGPFKTYGRYANGVVMTISGDFENGIKWIGDKGWIFVCRDGMTSPTSTGAPATPIVPLRASDPTILDSVIGPAEYHVYTSDDQHGNWLDCIRSRKAPVAPAEIGHRACSTCLLHWIAMKTQHHVYWDPKTEMIMGDDIAASLLSRHLRHPYEIA
ncbi:Oxidoreductase domain protein [Candidatus Sulfotelmatomonas gaucii]|uniref:Oxidoreductase domain protein n=1 Tax=Candidatus Sulfuritelmatomonas gaucii TaxID=2043161 RepID=A0A2N9LE87_9BACT|nr:Oxidoreductase domain protein [Candidatus Sulfotelmatomonas gaucii]